MGEGQHAVAGLVRRLRGGHEQHALKAQLLAHFHGHAHVPRVDGIETAAEDADPAHEKPRIEAVTAPLRPGATIPESAPAPAPRTWRW